MGGIAGWLSPNIIQKGEISQLEKMLTEVRHRGRDIEGCYLDAHIALSNNIISTTDLIPSPRPLISEDKRFHIAFDGVIFNRLELSKVLRRVGSKLKNICDEEIAIELYRYYGVQGFAKVEGTFSLVMWDTQEHLAVLVRDKSGQKPLFYYQDSERFYFSSEIKAISAVVDSSLNIDYTALHALLNFQFLTNELSIFKKVAQIQPGTAVSWQQTGVQLHKLNYKKLTVDESVEDTFLGVLESRLDYPSETGVILEENPYSYIIAAQSNKEVMQATKNFYLNEQFSDHNANSSKVDFPYTSLHGKEVESPQLDVEFFRKMIWHMELPLTDGIIPFINYQACAQKRKIFLSSAGAREIFMNKKYYSYLYYASLMVKCNIHKVTNPILRQYDNKYSAYESFSFGSKGMGRYQFLQLLEQFPMLYASLNGFWDAPVFREKIYGEAVLDNQRSMADISNIFLQQWSMRGSLLDQARRFELEHKLPQQILWAEDRASSAIGSEARCVYVSDHVFAAMRREATQEVFRIGRPNAFFKHAFADFLPSDLCSRSGLYHPEQSLMGGQVQHWMSEVYKVYLSPDMINKYRLFNPVFINSLLKLNRKNLNFSQAQVLFMMAGMHALLDLFQN